MRLTRIQVCRWLAMLMVVLQNNGIAMAQNNDDTIFSDCTQYDYYDQLFQGRSIQDWTRSELAQLLQETHRRVLPYTSSSREDTWDALTDLDAIEGSSSNMVRLIYADVSAVSADNYGVPTTWNREHLWPKSRGVGTSGPDYTDIHALRPSDWNVNSARGNLFFGDCATACTSRPATAEAAADTAKNAQVFLPPANVRGDIARALFYMELRYSFVDERSTTALELTDCPNADDVTEKYQMAYLSELLEWHEQDPVDDRERLRNDKASCRWQGNRNLFVDFPELATILHGESKSKPYRCNNVETPSPSPLLRTVAPTMMPTIDMVYSAPTEIQDTGAPTATVPLPTTNAPTAMLPTNTQDPVLLPTLVPTTATTNTIVQGCADLLAGDVQIIGVNSDNPDSVALVALEDLPSGMNLYITDNAWTGASFRTNEGTLKLQVPPSGIAQGSVFGYGETSFRFNKFWQSNGGGGSFALSTAGDSIIVYCQSEGGEINHLGALLSGQWETEEGTNFNSNESALPQSLATIGAIQITAGWDNAVYQGITTGTKTRLLEALAIENNWVGSNTERVTFSEKERRGATATVDFLVAEEDDGSTSFTAGGGRCASTFTSTLFVALGLLQL